MRNHEVVYYRFGSNEPAYFKDEDGVFEFNSNNQVAYIEDNIWYSYKTREPIAFEEYKVIFDYSSGKQLLYREDS